MHILLNLILNRKIAAFNFIVIINNILKVLRILLNTKF